MWKSSSLLRVSSKAVSSKALLGNASFQRASAISAFDVSSKRFNSTSNTTTAAASEIQNQLPSFDSVSETITTTTAAVSQAAGEASLQFGYLQSIGLAKSWWWPPDLIQHILEITHVTTGLPWWATITVVTLGVRAALFPLYVKSSDMMARNAKIKPQLDVIQNKLMSSVDMSVSQLAVMERKKLLQENGIKNRYLMAPMVQLPLAIGFFSGIRAMANYPVDGFTTEGAFWFPDLAAADPYLGLQCLSAAVIIGFMRLGGETGAQQFSPTMKKVFTVLPLISIPATMSFSSGVVLYFFVNSLFSIFQSFILKNKAFRNYMGLADIVPPAPLDPAKASEGIMDTFKNSIEKAREQAERRQKAKDLEDQQKKAAEQQKNNSKIKIVRRKDLK
ncbi:hypothetical protein WICPIJ_003740 [Wickerhamomyces pijperi]|uniref:Membrane insertase YidC/Oxa/ALB C-terminal domain-containing protein n=1 Tax=Wickerhamomyces pijperi TaxID=599730 RepID=A0A9P8TNY2_WICPI|nr:hypothetical protein WICPIJ_003740 [Wickerhamomyces pijperi]